MLEKYKTKRNFAVTPEPGPAPRPRAAVGKGRGAKQFVVQKHDASRLHYDFRLEADGVLASWAVPKGPSLDPHQRRLAVRVEDHPVEYAGFEGTIPEDEYGGGEVIVWDNGTYEPLVDDEPVRGRAAGNAVREGLEAGKLSFLLHGSKLKGAWTLVRTSGNESEWLLIKKADEFAEPVRNILSDDRSVISFRTVEDVKAGRPGLESAEHTARGSAKPGSPVRTTRKAAAARLAGELEVSLVPGARLRALNRAALEPMLATLADKPFDNPDWAFEPKMDGMRIIAQVDPQRSRVTFMSRRGQEASHVYPGLREELSRTQKRQMVIDGEIVATDRDGAHSFQTLQQRINLTRKADIDRADAAIPVVLYVFDILHLDGYDLRGARLQDRRRLLQIALAETERVRLVAASDGEGELAYRLAVEHGFEGIVAKRLDSTYESGRRSRSWLKVKSTLSEEFVIGGFTRGEGRRSDTFGSLLVGQYGGDGRLKFCGHVGTGFNSRSLREVLDRVTAIETSACPFSPKPIVNAEAHWVRPEISAEIKFAARTSDLQLRAPVFLQLREDKPATQATIQEPVPAPDMGERQKMAPALPRDRRDAIEALRAARDEVTVQLAEGDVHVTSLDKALWPAVPGHPAFTKRDLATYLLRMSPHLLGFLKDRFITLTRYPDGIMGKHFFQRHWAHKLPDFVDTVMAYSEDNSADREFLLCNNAATLLWLGQLGNIEIHAWFSRISRAPDAQQLGETFTGSASNIEASVLNYPDMIAFDLDPYIYSGREKPGAEPEFNAPAFKQTCEIAQLLRSRLEGLGLVPFLKTSGKTGLHVYVPILRRYTFDATRSACEAICRHIERERPMDVTLEWSTAKRTGKVFLDYNMNVRSKTVASVYSPRAVAGGRVSAPVTWDELEQIHPADLNLATVPDRLDRLGDLWANILDAKHDLGAIVNGAS